MSFDIFGIGAILTIVAILLSLYWMFLSPQTQQNESSDGASQDLISVSIDEFCLRRNGDVWQINEDEAQTIVTKFKGNKLVLIATANDDSDAESIRQVFSESILLSIVPQHRLILSEKEEGRISIVRQLQPSVHYDTSQAVISGLTGKVRQVVSLTDSFPS